MGGARGQFLRPCRSPGVRRAAPKVARRGDSVGSPEATEPKPSPGGAYVAAPAFAAYEDLGKFYVAVEQSLSVVIISDTEGKIEYVNPMFTTISGWTLEE